jgi:hypothetical protein
MPFLGKSTKHRNHGHIGPYGPGAGFAIGSGDRLAARRREAAQIKALMIRYPGALPQAMNAVASGMFGDGQSAANPDAFGGLRRGIGFDQFAASGWEDPTATLPHLFSRSRFQSSLAFPPSGGLAFVRRPQFSWPAAEYAEVIHRNQRMRRPLWGEGFPEELYARRRPDDDCLDAYDGFGTTYFPYPFVDDQRGSFGPPQNGLFGGHPYHGSAVASDNARFDRPFSARQDRGGPFDPPGPQAHSWRGSPRHSYERLRPEDL